MLTPKKGIDCQYGKLFLSIFRITVAAFFAFNIAKMIPFQLYEGSNELFIRLELLVLPMIVAFLLYLLFTIMLRVSIILELFARIKGTKK